MTDFFSWSIDLGRWAGSRVRVHCTLVYFAIFALLGGISSEPTRFLPTLAWLGLLFVVLVLHELGHLAAAAWQQAEAEDVMIWPLGNLIGPSGGRSHENPWVAAGGLFASGGLALATFLGLWLSGVGVVLSPFGNWPDAGAPYVPGSSPLAQITPLTPAWYASWFGWLNWVVFVANLLLPALPFDMGRIVRATIGRPGLGESRDAMIAPWLAHVAAGLLGIVGAVRLLSTHRLDSITLIFLAVFIELFVRAEARMMEDGSFFDDGVFGYDFSEGYTSLEASTAKVRPHRESALKRWRRRRSVQRKQRLQAQFAADDRRLDEILDKLHREGKASLTDEENRFLVRVSGRIKKRPRDRE
jgi:stage IV sporulation protein FB